jgi:hypothetical protein
MVYSGILEPGGTYEFGAITHPLYNWLPSLITDLDPMWTSSSITHAITEQLSSITTLFPILFLDYLY